MEDQKFLDLVLAELKEQGTEAKRGFSGLHKKVD
ncbi:unnamed protein product, partial [marine sediment metagenome]